jgi:hypothetical protein
LVVVFHVLLIGFSFHGMHPWTWYNLISFEVYRKAGIWVSLWAHSGSFLPVAIEMDVRKWSTKSGQSIPEVHRSAWAGQNTVTGPSVVVFLALDIFSGGTGPRRYKRQGLSLLSFCPEHLPYSILASPTFWQYSCPLLVSSLVRGFPSFFYLQDF